MVGSLLVLLLPTAVCQPAQKPVPAAGTEEVLNLYGIDPLTLDPALSGEEQLESNCQSVLPDWILKSGIRGEPG